MQEKTLEEELKDLTCVNGAMYFGAVEEPCSGRETGECCQNEQTYKEAFSELLSFISSREEKAREEGRKEAIQQKSELLYPNEIITQYKEELLVKLKSKGFDISESDL
jgi:hypothetical protein